MSEQQPLPVEVVYQHLPVEHQRAMIQQRIQTLEEMHYSLSLNLVEVESSPHADDVEEHQADINMQRATLVARIEALRKMLPEEQE